MGKLLAKTTDETFIVELTWDEWMSVLQNEVKKSVEFRSTKREQYFEKNMFEYSRRKRQWRYTPLYKWLKRAGLSSANVLYQQLRGLYINGNVKRFCWPLDFEGNVNQYLNLHDNPETLALVGLTPAAEHQLTKIRKNHNDL